VSHGNAARLAGYHGAAPLAQLLSAVASDEARHEAAAAAVVGKLLQADPEAALLALADVVTRGVVMPGARMDDGWHGRANARSASSSSGGGGGGGGGGDGGGDSSDGGGGDAQGSEGGGSGADPDAAVVGRGNGNAGGNGGSQLYRDYAAAADALGVFTVADHAAGLEQLLGAWEVSSFKADGRAAVKLQLTAARCGGC
jgi:hypothetical protein